MTPVFEIIQAYPMNAAWTAFTACSPLAKSMTAEIFISLVEIMSMFTTALASVSNNFPATLVCDFMPTPTMDSSPLRVGGRGHTTQAGDTCFAHPAQKPQG